MNYKKLIFVACGVSVVANAISEKDKFLMTLTSAHTRTFSKENLITERIPMEDSAVWNSLLTEIAKYIQANKSRLAPEFEKLQAISNQLLNTLKIVYSNDIAPAITDAAKKQTGLNILAANSAAKINKSLININSIKEKIAVLANQENVAKQVSKDLESKWLLSGVDKEIAQILKQLALTLEVTVAKVFRDFEKLQKFVQSK